MSTDNACNNACTHECNYTNLVLEGGGVLGVAHCGALLELESRGILNCIVNFACASAGRLSVAFLRAAVMLSI
jgi:NTE family protein